jgi:Phosphotransferase enzyme family
MGRRQRKLISLNRIVWRVAISIRDVNLEGLSGWCETHLHSGIDAPIFQTGFATRVFGVRLHDGREVVLKLRSYTQRLRGTAAVHTHLWKATFPCPELLVSPTPFASAWISAESLVSGGHVLTDDREAPELYAEALADLVARAPAPDQLPELLPPPAWLHWNHAESGVWPRPDHHDVDLNAFASPAWLTDAAQRARARLRQCAAAPVVGHADWWSENLRWNGRELHVVFDWDSITAQPEPIVAGAAAYMFAATTFEIEGSAPAANVAQSERFLLAYARARGRPWTREEWETAWAASVWVAAYQVQLSALEAVTGAFSDLVRHELPERLLRAGL